MIITVGTNITVFDPFSSQAPFMWPTAYYVVALEADYYIVRLRYESTRLTERIPKSCKHIRVD